MKRGQGFSMIEVLVVLLMLAVLAAMAYPSFQQHVIRSKRVEAQAALLGLMQQQERFFTQNNRYLEFSSSSTGPEERRFKWWSGLNAATSAYELEGAACAGERIADCVQLTATPGTAQVDPQYKDTACEKLILTSSGQRLATGPGPRCWP